jgi:NAD(P)-dependent dehydrogenase (short-subunit alcohol dehydrogenase family)
MAIILITGASTGIGQEAAIHLARRGHRVYAGVRSPDKVDDLRQRAADENLPLQVVRLDVVDQASVNAAIREIMDAEGRIDVVVNNAGIGGGRAVEETPIEEARAIFETNYFGQARVIAAVAPIMRAQQGGRMIIVGSLAATNTMGCHAHYSASKRAMTALSEALAFEMAPFNVRVAIIEPGVVITPIWGKGEMPADDSPYGVAIKRLMRFFEYGFTRPAMPEDAAAAIVEAIEAEDPKFRYPVGADAEECIAARARISDEEWIAMNRLDDAAFARRWKEVSGVDYYSEALAAAESE